MIVTPTKGGEIILKGGVIAYPTETVWGLGGNPFKGEVVERIFEIKKRPAEKSFILLVDSIEMVSDLVEDITKEEENIMKKFWPGPLTIVFPVRKSLKKMLGETVALRISPHPVVKELLEVCKMPIISTSANITGQKPARTFSEVRKLFEKEVDAIVEGESWGKEPSTLINVREKKILREGAISVEELLPFLG